MWRDWIAAGFDPAAFWRITLREFGVIMKGAEARFDRDRALVQYEAWLTGRLVGVGVNAPGSYPKPEQVIDTGSGRRRKAQTDDEIEAMIRFMHVSLTGETIQ